MSTRVVFRHVAAVLLLVAGASALARPLAADKPPETAPWAAAVRSLRADPARGASVQGLLIERDAATFRLETGQIQLLRNLEDRVVGAVWTGEGTFTLEAPEPVERAHLVRTLGAEAVSRKLRSAVFLAGNLAMEPWIQDIAWAPAAPARDADKRVEQALDYVTDADGWIYRGLGLAMANGAPGFFWAHIVDDRDRPLVFSIDPSEFEEVALFHRAGDKGRFLETVTRFHARADYVSGSSLPQESLDLVRIDRWDIETRIADDLKVAAAATATLARTSARYRWVPFTLFHELRVDSIRWRGGERAPFHRGKDSNDLWVDLGAAPAEGGALEFHYGGNLLERPKGLWVTVKSHDAWFPVYAFDRSISYRMTFRTPEKLTLASVGSLVAEELDASGKVRTTIWETPPVRWVTFNLGSFAEHRVAEPGAPPITVQVDERSHRALGGMAAQAGAILFDQDDRAGVVARDIGRSFAFFGEVFGPPPVDAFVATEIPYDHGQAFPGLVLLSWSTYQYTSSEGFDEIFRAHEVAHQWWGIGVRPASYHDQWLAEGFSEFSGLWYAARGRGSVAAYEKRLAEAREALIDRRGKAPPLSLGYRTGTFENPGDHPLVVYRKGAWVLHMLRTLLMDPETGNDDAFTGIMRDFYASYRGRAASTADFQAVVERSVGADMTWFFDQWVHGADVPRYVWSHALNDLPDGSVEARVRIRQEEVPSDFRMIVPILVDFGPEGSSIVRVNVTGADHEIVLPVLPKRPVRLVFNPNEAVLAEVKTERWSGS